MSTVWIVQVITGKSGVNLSKTRISFFSLIARQPDHKVDTPIHAHQLQHQ